MSKNEDQRPVGAQAKLARARALNNMGAFDPNFRGSFGGSASERVYATIFVVALACIAAWFLGDGPLRAGVFGATGNSFIDEFILAANPVYIGDPMIDPAIAVVLRAVVLLLVAGIIPALSWMWGEIIDRPQMSPYRIVWGMTIAVLLVALLMKPVFGSLVSSLLVATH